MVAEAFNVKLNLKKIDMEKKEHLTPEYLKLNPQHTVPTLVDNGFSIWESRAICLYLADKYGKDSSIYPSDLQTRAVINQRLYFDFTLYDRLGAYYYTFFYGTEQKPEDLKKFEETVELLDKFLAGSEFFAGTKSISIADILLFSTVSSIDGVGFDLSPYKNVSKWFAKIGKIVPGREFNTKSFDAFRVFFQKK